MKKKNTRDYQRDKEVFELRQAGVLFKELASKFKISVERARQLYWREKDRRNKI